MPRNGSMTATLGMPTDPFANLHICQVQIQTNQYSQLCMTGKTLFVNELLLLTKAEGRRLTVTSPAVTVMLPGFSWQGSCRRHCSFCFQA